MLKSDLYNLITDEDKRVNEYIKSITSLWNSTKAINFEKASKLIESLYHDEGLETPLILVCDSPWIPASLIVAWSTSSGIDRISSFSNADLISEKERKWWNNTKLFCQKNNLSDRLFPLEACDPSFGTNSDSPFNPNRCITEKIKNRNDKMLSEITNNFISLDYNKTIKKLKNLIEPFYQSIGDFLGFGLNHEIFTRTIYDCTHSIINLIHDEALEKYQSQSQNWYETIDAVEREIKFPQKMKSNFNIFSQIQMDVQTKIRSKTRIDQDAIAQGIENNLFIHTLSGSQLVYNVATHAIVALITSGNYFIPEIEKELILWFELGSAAYSYSFFENVCFVCRRPTRFELDEVNRLHNENDAAIEFADGYKQFYIQGRRIPGFVVEEPEKITVGKIENERNIEVRRIMLEKFGFERFITESNAVKVSEDNAGVLYRKELPGDEPIVAVMVTNSTPEPDGTFKKYFLRVPPEVQTAKQGVAWTFNLGEQEYNPDFES